jgi:hypothetical protein
MPPSGARWPVRHGLASLSATSCRSPCRCASSSCKALAIAAACSLATFVSASASSASACSAFARALAAFACDLCLACLLRILPLAWEPHSNAPARPWTVTLLVSQAPPASDLTLVTRTTTRCCPEALAKLHPQSPAAIRKARTSGPRQPGPFVPGRSSAGDAQGQRRQAAVLDQRAGPRPTRMVLTVAPADSPRWRSAAPVPLPAPRDEPCRRYPVHSGRPQTYRLILMQSAGRRPFALSIGDRW